MQKDFTGNIWNRIDGLEEKIKYAVDEIKSFQSSITKLIDPLEDRVKAIEESHIMWLSSRDKTEPKDSKREEDDWVCVKCGIKTDPQADHYCEPKPEPWKPKEQEFYFYIGADFKIYEAKRYSKDLVVESGNCFRTREQAEAFLEIIKKARKEMK